MILLEEENKKKKNYSLRKKESWLSWLSCIWKNLGSKLCLCIQGEHASMKILSQENKKTERSLFGACVIKHLESVLCFGWWSTRWLIFKMLENWNLDSGGGSWLGSW